MENSKYNTALISAVQFFDEFGKSLTENNIRKVYYIYRNCLTKAVEQKLQGVTLQFTSGLASKIDYLLKEYDADSSLRRNRVTCRTLCL